MQSAAAIPVDAEARIELSIFGVWVLQISAFNRCILFRVAAAHPSYQEGRRQFFPEGWRRTAAGSGGPGGF